MTAYVKSSNEIFRTICNEELKYYGFDLVFVNHTYVDLVIYEIESGATDIPLIDCKLLALISAYPASTFTIPRNAVFFRKPIETSYMIDLLVNEFDEILK